MVAKNHLVRCLAALALVAKTVAAGGNQRNLILKTKAHLPATTSTIHHPPPHHDPLLSSYWSNKLQRGGATCSDTDMSLFLKVGTSALVETGTMLATLKLGSVLTETIKSQPTIALFGGGSGAAISLTQLLSILAVTFGSSFFGSIVDGGLSAATRQIIDPNTTPGTNPEWYSSLKKPWWNPPGWVFPIMWLVVSKPTQVVAISKLIITTTTQQKQDKADSFPLQCLAVYCGHLALGDAWNKVFFGLECLGRGAFVISVFYAMLAATIFLFSQMDLVAAKFLLPTFAWVTVATGLSWSIYLKNK